MKLQQRVRLFQERLQQVISGSGINRSALAASIKVDRPTLSRLPAPNTICPPRNDTVVSIAEVHQDMGFSVLAQAGMRERALQVASPRKRWSEVSVARNYGVLTGFASGRAGLRENDKDNKRGFRFMKSHAQATPTGPSRNSRSEYRRVGTPGSAKDSTIDTV
ncbi:MAG: hypothetical protein OEU50_22545 [Gammaproteobacteria bacterium]|nr:hypothetical protein [Gammaproteobacteria bacterium]